MSPRLEARIREAAIRRGRAERREQGIPEQVTDPELTAKLAALFQEGRAEYGRPRTTGESL